jgi:hypothetical protein
MFVGCSVKVAAQYIWWEQFRKTKAVLNAYQTSDLPSDIEATGREQMSMIPRRRFEPIKLRKAAPANMHWLARPRRISGSEGDHVLTGASFQPRSISTLSRNASRVKLRSGRDAENVSRPSIDTSSGGIVVSNDAADDLGKGGSSTTLVRAIRVDETSYNESEEAPTTAIDLEEARPSIDFPTYFSTSHKAYAGSAIDHNWHLSMAAFILGALPQAIKVFAMSCIPGTQACTAVLLAAFVVPEMFSVVAGPADTFDFEHMPIADLHRMPLVERAKYATANDKRFGIYFAMVVTLSTDLACFLQGWPFEKLYLVAASSSSAFIATCYSFGITYLCRTHRSRLIADDPRSTQIGCGERIWLLTKRRRDRSSQSLGV